MATPLPGILPICCTETPPPRLKQENFNQQEQKTGSGSWILSSISGYFIHDDAYLKRKMHHLVRTEKLHPVHHVPLRRDRITSIGVI